MPFYFATGSYTGSVNLMLTLVIPPDQMLTGTVTYSLVIPVNGIVTGSLFGESGSQNISGSMGDDTTGLTGSYTLTSSYYSAYATNATGSLTGTFAGAVTFTIYPGSMLTGTVTLNLTSSANTVTGFVSGTISGSTNSGSMSGAMGANLTGSFSAGTILGVPIGGPYTGSLLSAPYLGVVTLTIPTDYALVGTVQFGATGSVAGLVSGALFTNPPSGLPLQGNVQGDTFAGPLSSNIAPGSAGLKKLGAYEDSTRMRRSYPFFRPRAKKIRYIIE